MENRKGSGIFLGVVSIATLVVAIIGATFAFFSASITGEGDIGATAYEFSASLSISPVYPSGSANLIPMDPDGTVIGGTPTNTTNLLYAINEAESKCRDSNDFQVCAVYSATFTNNSTTAVKLNGSLVTTANNASTSGNVEDATAFKNLKFVELGGTKADTGNNSFTIGTTYAVPTSTTEGSNSVSISSVTIPGKSGDNAGTITKYFLVYLDEAEADNETEMGATYTGQLVYSSGAEGELTGTFNLGTE